MPTLLLHTLSDAFNNGLMLDSHSPDLGTVQTQVQHIMYSQLVIKAWMIAPEQYFPIVLKTSNPCSSTAQGDLSGYMTNEVAAQTHVCYDGFTFYVVTVTWFTSNLAEEVLVILDALLGGTWDNMQNPLWANLSLDDFATWEGYKKNGMKNGYSSEANGSYI